jgi:hypothetical protein
MTTGLQGADAVCSDQDARSSPPPERQNHPREAALPAQEATFALKNSKKGDYKKEIS